ncbi:Sas10/Utp3/C1D family-domain-containing protein [Xylariaceae sp. FL0804]|nr:Sas10/Utp3/C1D family-domain-containing protein [Xylariaceae sp. FL0804]
MDPTSILPQLERLDDELDNLEEALQPLMGGVSDVASKLPLLDKAKLYVLVTYAIESMLFSSLRLNGVNAKEHPVFKELTRVRQYFEKIANIESPPAKPEKTLDKGAAIRFIRSDLANDKEVNAKLKELIVSERAKAAQKSAQLGEKRKAEEVPASSDESSEEDESEEASPEPAPKKQKTKEEKKDKKSKRLQKDKKAKKSKKTSGEEKHKKGHKSKTSSK